MSLEQILGAAMLIVPFTIIFLTVFGWRTVLSAAIGITWGVLAMGLMIGVISC